MDFKLILKKLNKKLTEEETITFSKWYNESQDHKAYFKKVSTNYPNNLESINTNSAWKAVEHKIEGSRKNNAFWKYGIAASLLLFMALSYFFFTKEDSNVANTIVINNNISAGTDKATLTLEDGTTVALKKGEHFSGQYLNSNGEQIIYTAKTASIEPKTEYNYLTVPLGGEYYVELSDNTKVWLNSDSQLKYPVTFKKGETRVIELVYGEAYFDVSPSTNHSGSSFKVLTKSQEIEVLGTAFNIKAYKNENTIYTSLLEGKVNVKTTNNSEILIPNQQSIVNTTTNSLIKVQHEDIEKQIAWKNGLFMFDKIPLHEILTTLSRWYDISFEFENLEKQNMVFSGVLDRDKSITDLLNNFQKTGEVLFKVTDRTIIIN